MTDTRERILMTALRLFARNGYEAVSVSDIAGALGMTKGALYRHYKNKRDIFDCIVGRMIQIDAQRAALYHVPQKSAGDAPESYRSVSMDSVREFTLAQFEFWTQDEFASNFRRMLNLEQYRSREMADLYNGCIVSGPVSYMEDIFREMIREGVLRQADPKQLALEYYAPLYLLIQICDGADGHSAQAALLSAHIDRFLRLNAANQ